MENFQNIENAIGNIPGFFFLWLDGKISVQFFDLSTTGVLGHAWWQVHSGGSFYSREDCVTQATNPVSCGRKFQFLIFHIQNSGFIIISQK